MQTRATTSLFAGLMVAVLALSACSEQAATMGSSSGTPVCTSITAQVDRTLERVVIGVGRAGGGCGAALVAFADGWQAVKTDGEACAAAQWPPGFVAGRARTLVGSGLLVTDVAGANVRRLRLQGDEHWLSLPLATTTTAIVDADESACGDRYVVLATDSGAELHRLAADGHTLWQEVGELTSIAATCDGVLVAGQTVSPAEPRYSTRRQGWLARLDGAGAEVWRKDYPSEQDLRIASLQLVGDGVGVHIVVWNLAHYEMKQRLEVLAGDGTSRMDRAMPGRVIGGNGHSTEDSLPPQPWPVAGVGWVMAAAAGCPRSNGHSTEDSLPPQPWPVAGVGWVMNSGYWHPGGQCHATARVEALRASGASPLVRELRQGLATSWAVLDDGSVLIGGESACTGELHGWLLGLPKCR